MEAIKEKTTSKREFAFVCNREAMRVDIVNEADETVRSYKLTDLSPDIRTYATLHGLKQKLTDDTMKNKLKDGEDRLDACDSLWERLCADQWDKEREGGIGRAPEALVQFVMEAKGIERGAAESALKKAGKEKWDAIKTANADAIAKIEKRIAEEKTAGAKMELDDLL